MAALGEEHEDSEHRGNGRARLAADVQELRHQSEQVRGDLKALAGTVRKLARECEDVLRERVEQRPYAMLAMAAGVGYVLGGGVPGVLLRVLFGTAGRVALESALLRFATQAAGADMDRDRSS
jgi:hypothetical protein